MPKTTDYAIIKVTARSLNAYLATTRISKQNREIAKAALIDGVAVSTLAQKHNVTPPGIYRLLNTIRDGIGTMGTGGGNEWWDIKIQLPQSVAHELHLWARQLKSTTSPTIATSAISTLQTAILKSRNDLSASQ